MVPLHFHTIHRGINLSPSILSGRNICAEQLHGVQSALMCSLILDCQEQGDKCVFQILCSIWELCLPPLGQGMGAMGPFPLALKEEVAEVYP